MANHQNFFCRRDFCTPVKEKEKTQAKGIVDRRKLDESTSIGEQIFADEQKAPPTVAEKVKETRKDVAYLGVIIAGVAVTGGLYFLLRELWSSKSPGGISDISEEGKRLALMPALTNAYSGYAIGMGTGSTVKHAILRLGEKYRSGQLKDIVCVPSSLQSRQLIIENGLPLGDLDRYQELDVYVDGADEVDQDLNCIKGGGGCHTQEKIVMSCSKYFYIIADSRKMSSRLGETCHSIPLEVLSMAWAPIKRRIEHSEGGQAQVRMSTGKAGPVITDNGAIILDWNFPKLLPDGCPRSSKEWSELNVRLQLIPGVLETGLFLSCARSAFFGFPDGSVVQKKVDEDHR